MAKLKGKAKAAFLKRMARGRSKARRRVVGAKRRKTSSTRGRRKITLKGYATPSKKRPSSYRIRLSNGRRRNPYAVIANPGEMVPYDSALARYWRGVTGSISKRKKGRKSMAKKRRKSTKRRAKARRAKRRIASIRPSKRTRYVYVNPRGRRKKRRRSHARRRNPSRRRRHVRHRNPSFMRSLKPVFVAYATGFVTSGVVAVFDTMLADKPVLRNFVKVGASFAIGFFGRRHPVAATAAIASIAATQGYSQGTKLAGGFIARNPAEAKKGLGEMADTYPELGALLADGGVAALLNGPESLDTAVNQYREAVSNMAGDDD